MDLLETCGGGGGRNEGERGGVWRKLARGYPALTGYIQTGQGQDRTVVGGETRKWKSGRVGAWGA